VVEGNTGLGQEHALARLEELDRIFAVRRWCEAVLVGEIDPDSREFVEVARILDAARQWHARSAA
jgi:hypothetical protein